MGAFVVLLVAAVVLIAAFGYAARASRTRREYADELEARGRSRR